MEGWGDGVQECWQKQHSTTPALQNSVSLSCGDFFETGLEIAFATQADNLVGDLALAKQEQSGNGPNAIFGGESLFVVNIDFYDLDAALVFLGQLVEDRANHLTRTAPFGPEINENRRRGLKHFCRKIFFGGSNNIGGRHKRIRKSASGSSHYHPVFRSVAYCGCGS